MYLIVLSLHSSLQVDTKRIRIKQFFAESDRLRSGNISIAKFHTAINRSGLILDANDIHTLDVEFKSKTKPDQIDYEAFLDAVDHTVHVEDCNSSSEGNSSIDRDSNSTSYSQSSKIKSPEALDAILNRIRQCVECKR